MWPLGQFQSQDADAKCEMNSQEDHQTPFSKLDQRLVGKSQKMIKPLCAIDCAAKQQKMQGQKNRKRNTRKSMTERGEIALMAT